MKKFPLRRQHDSMQCGVACLQMLCSYFGKEYPLEELDRLCRATNRGVSLLGISHAASELGIHTICGRLTVKQLEGASKPCILHWRQNHFVVLYRIRRGGRVFCIADPGKGLMEYGREEFLSAWLSVSKEGEERGIAMLAEPTPAFYAHKTEKQKGKRSFRFLFGYVKRYRQYFGQVALGLFVGSLMQLALPFLTQSIVDVGIAFRDLDFILLILLAQLMIALGSMSVDFIRRWILLHIGMRINISLLSDFFIKLLKLPMAFFDIKQMGDLLQRMGDHSRIEKFLTADILETLFSVVSFLVLGLALLSYSTVVFIVFLAGSLLYGGWLALFLKKRRALDYLYFEKQAENSGKTYQFVTTMQEIKLQDCEQRRRWEWEDVQADLFAVNMRLLKLQQTQEAGSIFINQTKNIVITVITAMSVIDGGMTLGGMLAVQYIIGQLNTPISQFMTFLYSLQDVKISLERINEIHTMKNEEPERQEKTDTLPENGNISLEHVCFRYDAHMASKVLDDISVTIPEGKVTAIVGTSGSGKTTLLKLLLGFYLPESGEIRIGGTDLNRFDIRWWRRQCGVVMQNGAIFSESVARNIAVGDGEIDVQNLRKAARMACIADFIESLPMKYDTIIGQDGTGLSQGQKQRILIARAIYKNPKYLIFDEATNSLDTDNEAAIVRNLEEFYKGRTVVIVAHRLSTVRNADQIIVLSRGRITEIGTSDELIVKKGDYYRLVKNQLEIGV